MKKQTRVEELLEHSNWNFSPNLHITSYQNVDFCVTDPSLRIHSLIHSIMVKYFTPFDLLIIFIEKLGLLGCRPLAHYCWLCSLFCWYTILKPKAINLNFWFQPLPSRVYLTNWRTPQKQSTHLSKELTVTTHSNGCTTPLIVRDTEQRSTTLSANSISSGMVALSCILFSWKLGNRHSNVGWINT